MEQKSSIYAAGQGNKRNGSKAVKADHQTQRQTKERAKGIKPSGFLDGGAIRSFQSPVGTTGTWFFADLYDQSASSFQFEDDTVSSLETHKDILSWCIQLLCASPSARMMIAEATQEGWHVGIEDQYGYDFHLDVPEKRIILDGCGLLPEALGRSEYFRSVLLISFIRALRDIWQEKRHGGFDEEYGPDDILMLERVRAADCDVMSVLVSWELRSEGKASLWRHLIGSEEGDLAVAFSTHLERRAASFITGDALAAAFTQWYQAPERVDACDHETLEYMDGVIQENPGQNPFGDKKLTPVGVEVLSCLPDKTAYLKNLGGNILMDPLYAGLGDLINQSHYMQIIYDLQVTYVDDIPFRDPDLARKIFPDDTLANIAGTISGD